MLDTFSKLVIALELTDEEIIKEVKNITSITNIKK